MRTPLVLLARNLAGRSGAAALELSELRLVCDQGKALGVMAPQKALDIASERKLKLVEVAAAASPPVWRLMVEKEPEDPEKVRQREQRQLEQERQQRIQSKKPVKPPKQKEVRLADRCDPRDADTKAENAKKFLAKGHEVKVIALNTGRIDVASSKSMAEVLVQQICDKCAELATNGGIFGRKQAEGGGGRQIVGQVTATLSPRDGPRRDPPTERTPRKGKKNPRPRPP